MFIIDGLLIAVVASTVLQIGLKVIGYLFYLH